jgi:hypothetical protein
MRAPSHTIRIKKHAPHGLIFDVLDPHGALLARSAPYSSICKLEAALDVLRVAAASAESPSVEFKSDFTWLKPRGRRSRVALAGSLPSDHIAYLLIGLRSASVIDDRAPNERRADTSGQLCDLAH